MDFKNEREWAAELVATINDQLDAIMDLPARTPAEQKLAADLRGRAIELIHWSRVIQRNAEFAAMTRENSTLRRQINRLDNARR
jgi:hypothetical protein